MTRRLWLILTALWALRPWAPVVAAGESAPPPRFGKASWYGWDHAGKIMANGHPFNPRRFTCASWYYPLGTRLLVSHGGRSVVVTVSDRGPAKRFVEAGRILDLSLIAFMTLAPSAEGLIAVEVVRL